MGRDAASPQPTHGGCAVAGRELKRDIDVELDGVGTHFAAEEQDRRPINDSQYLLRQVRFHSGPEYVDAIDDMFESVEIGADFSVRGTGSWYVTFIRERNPGGPEIAYTTARPIDLVANKTYALTIFDTSFRFAVDSASALGWVEPVEPVGAGEHVLGR